MKMGVWKNWVRRPASAAMVVAIVALALDLTLRLETDGKQSLDDVMRALWSRYGKTGRGVGEDDIERLVSEVTGVALDEFFDQALRGTRDLDLEGLLRQFGVDMELDMQTMIENPYSRPASGCSRRFCSNFGKLRMSSQRKVPSSFRAW